MKKNIISYLCIAVVSLTLFASCEDYLNKSLEEDITVEDVFADFVHAQGYADQLYYYVVNYAQSGNQNDGTNFLLGDEAISKNESMTSGAWEKGNFTNYKVGYFDRSGNFDFDGVLLMSHMGIWDGWAAIRIANQIIANEKNMVACTPTERDLLLGQAYFFRAYFHMEILKFWGRIPYVDKVLTGENNDAQMVRPDTYKETAMRIDEDFQKAIDLLPNHWKDLSSDPNATFNTFKSETLEGCDLRINDAIVYSFKGKNLLLAASPLMKGSTDTYDYDKELAEMAAEAFAHVINMVDNSDYTNNRLGLATKDNYTKLFWRTQADTREWVASADYMGGKGEFIFSSPAGHQNGCRAIATSFMPYSDGANRITPSHNFIHQTFGTANGLACDEDPSYKANEEFDNRDPRFYVNLIVDGDEIIRTAAAQDTYKYAQMYKDGFLYNNADVKKYYSTGYYIKKWAEITYNISAAIGNTPADGQNWCSPFWLSMRLTDVYLMYAEALAASDFGATGRPNYTFMSNPPTSIEVINQLRARFDVPTVQDAYSKIGINIEADANKYMDVLRRERATEMCFEAHRWTDLRRWVLAHELRYREKTAISFERDNYVGLTRDEFVNTNFSETVLLTRVCEYPKHYWLPFPTEMTQMYEGFEQNPGW